MIFGAPVQPEHVIGETLRRATPDTVISTDPHVPASARASASQTRTRTATHRLSEVHRRSAVQCGSKARFGITAEPGTERLVRATPRSSRTEGAATQLSDAHQASRQTAVLRRSSSNSWRSYMCAAESRRRGFPVFAFRLHQFISRGDTVYASLEPEAERYLTVQRQQFVPGDRERILLPLVFCRECGQEYYCVASAADQETRRRVFVPTRLSDHSER